MNWRSDANQERDEGKVHRFALDWSDEPTELIPLAGARVWAIGGPVHHTIELARPSN